MTQASIHESSRPRWLRRRGGRAKRHRAQHVESNTPQGGRSPTGWASLEREAPLPTVEAPRRAQPGAGNGAEVRREGGRVVELRTECHQVHLRVHVRVVRETERSGDAGGGSGVGSKPLDHPEGEGENPSMLGGELAEQGWRGLRRQVGI